MSVTLRHGGLPEGVSRRDLEQFSVELGREVFRFSEKTIQLLLHYLARTSETDFLAGRICGTWVQPPATANKFQMSIRALNYKECELEEAGLILRTGTPHAGRTGKRTGGGIVYLAGINFAPLIERYSELTTMLAAERLRQDRAPILRLGISEKRATIRLSGRADLITLADSVSCGGRTQRITNIERLEAIDAALEAIAVQAGLPSGAKYTSDRSATDFAPNKPCESISKHPTHSARANSDCHDVGTITPAAAIRLASADFRATLEWIGDPTWPNLIEASRRTCHDLGITQWVWGQACSKLGRQRAALCVLAIDRNHKLPSAHLFYCERPSGALFMMSRKSSDRLNLDRLLQAIQGYPEGLGDNIVPFPAPQPQQLPKGVHAIGNLVAEQFKKVGDAAMELQP